MADIKIVINDQKTGKSYKKELGKEESNVLFGKKIGEGIDGDSFGFSGYKFVITGGNDNSGFPMRRDMEGTKRKKALLTSGPGVKIKRKGMRKRKTVAGNTIGTDTSNINLKIITSGKKPIEQILGIEDKPKVEDKPKEADKETKTGQQTPAEESKQKPEEQKQEKPQTEQKQEKPQIKGKPQEKIEENKEEENKEEEKQTGKEKEEPAQEKEKQKS
ncbi:MAG: 30S ribosomal protein S6e [Nanoarchaeota archaeon]|nr:30S ribosomal protein S6e [Nanoarchaeota archaeon]